MPDIQNIQIIGIDCAADPANIGVAFAHTVGTRLTVDAVHFGERGTADEESRLPRLRQLAFDIANGIRTDSKPTLLALDAPLGWPASMAGLLGRHTAGSALEATADPDDLFRRQTDRVVVKRTHKTPIEVGANLIARVTHTTLRLIGMLRSELNGAPTEMADAPLRSHVAVDDGVNFIEVYPALAAPFFVTPELPADPKTGNPEYWYWRNLSTRVKELKEKEWGAIMTAISVPSDAGTDTGTISVSDAVQQGRTGASGRKITKEQRDHGLDAVLAAWTGLRFCLGRCVAPDDIDPGALEAEGWIWFDDRVPERVQAYRLKMRD